jgi:hypothetical protein
LEGWRAGAGGELVGERGGESVHCRCKEVEGECGRFLRGGGGMENLREDDIDRDVSERINDSLP